MHQSKGDTAVRPPNLYCTRSIIAIDVGEAEAIALAVEVEADQVLIDERRGRLVAARFNLRYTGLLGILVEAKSQGLIVEVKPLLNALINQAGFWIAEPLYNKFYGLLMKMVRFNYVSY